MINDDLERLELPEHAAEVSMSHNQPIGVPNLRDGEWSLKAGDRLYTESQIRAILAGRQRRAQAAEPVAEVVSKFGDPEAFGERDIRVLADLRKIPYRTKLYTRPAPAEVTDAMLRRWKELCERGHGTSVVAREIEAALGGGE